MLKVTGHIILSALLLIAATGMTINIHFCQGHLYDLAINTPADHCCDSHSEKHACHQDPDKATSHNCDDKSISIAASHDFLVSAISFNFEDLHSFDLFTVTQTLIETPAEAEIPASRIFNYKKPPPQEVVLSQIQSFLI